VHVPLGHCEIAVTGEFLYGPRQGSLHCQMRAERVPENVHSFLHVGLSCRALDPVLNLLPGKGRAIGLTEDPWSLQMTMITQRVGTRWAPATSATRRFSRILSPRLPH
jgi:hypothetical protein